MKAITLEPLRRDSARLEEIPITRCEPPDRYRHALDRQPDDINVVIQFSEA